MKKKYILVVFNILVIFSLALYYIKYHNQNKLNISNFIYEYAAKDNIIGMAVGYICDNKITYYTYGVASKANNKPITTNTIFEIGSITKIFTAITLLELVHEGKIKLNDPISKYLPQAKNLEKNGKPITFWNLATHTSGLPRLPTNFSPKNISNPHVDYGEKELNEFVGSYKLPVSPGEKTEYSNLGFGLLGYTLSTIEKVNYNNLIHKYITSPLGMNNTSQYLTKYMDANMAQGYNNSNQPVNGWDFDVLAGAGSLHSNIKDMTTFLAANMGIIETPLNESIKKSHEVQCSFINHQCFGWIVTQKNGTTIYWHNGRTGGFKSFIGFDLEHKKGVVVLSNSDTVNVEEFGFSILDSVNYKIASVN